MGVPLFSETTISLTQTWPSAHTLPGCLTKGPGGGSRREDCVMQRSSSRLVMRYGSFHK